MMMPGFTAELALLATQRAYRSARAGSAGSTAAGRPEVAPQAGVSGVYIGTACYLGVQTEVYVDFGDDGYTVTGFHPVAVGSC